MLDFFLNNPVTKRERQCYESSFKPGDSVDFIIDIAASPSLDKVDVLSAKSPIGVFMDAHKSYATGQSLFSQTPTRSYFDAIGFFVDIVSFDMRPDCTHTVIYDEKRKFYLRGRSINETFDLNSFGGEFSDVERNLKTMWPIATKSLPEGVNVKMAKVLTNNLGRMTRLALWNRDNGLPTVLRSTRRSKPVYSIVITDGSSGAKLSDLVDSSDLSRVTIIDIGNHRFVDRLDWQSEISRIRGGIYTLTAPQGLISFANSVRNMACWFGSNRSSEQ